MSQSHVHLVRGLARAFVNSKLTPVIILLSIFLGVMSVVMLPREEEPKIIVPMADVFVQMPGATPQEVTERVINPMEKLMQEVQGVEYIYSTAMPGQAMMTVRFYVGNDMEDSLVKLYNKLYSNFDKIPPGVSKPLIKPITIDDVPIITFTLWSDKYDGYTLRQIAAQLKENIKQTPEVAETEIIGGYKNVMKVELLPSAMSTYNVDPVIVMQKIQGANASSYLGNSAVNNKVMLLKVDGFLKSEEEVKNIVVSIKDDKPVYLKNVAQVELGPEVPDSYVLYQEKGDKAVSAVTICVAKRKGANATQVANTLIKKLKTVRKQYVPADVHITITRNYGETAAERSNELLIHMFIAVFSVTVLIWLVLGKRESWIVALAIPTTLALTLSTFVLYGFTLNRVTFFALIFSIGILVDDAIVVVENVVRHLRMPKNKDADPVEVTIEATDEVGNPTILATMTVIAAILPMAFVGGLMGPYMRPIPIGASSAMIFSMLIAFTVIPWATVRILGHGALVKEHGDNNQEDWMTRSYRKSMGTLINSTFWRKIFLSSILIALLLACSLVVFKLVRVKMLPFDNKSEFQIIIDTKEGTTLEDTTHVAQNVADYLITVDEVQNYQIYAGVASPFNFNGLVRHYYLREGPNVADIQVNLIPKINLLNPVEIIDLISGHHKRFAQSHDIAKRVRPEIDALAKKHKASIKIVEVPPGPPVLQTLVAEIYGPDYERQKEIARKIMKIFEDNPSVVDVDWYMEEPYKQLSMVIDHEKSTKLGFDTNVINQVLEVAFDGSSAGLLHDKNAKEDIPIWLQLPERLRSGTGDILSIRLINKQNMLVPLGNIVKFVMNEAPTSIYHKNLLPVVYVTAEVSGVEESPVYAIMDLYGQINKMELEEGYKLQQYFTQQPLVNDKYSMKWDGEWHITYEVFRDLGIAFIVVLVLIYALVVGWFQSFKTPFIIMSAIPFSLVGILPAHWLLGAFFTATSMIGFIAGAGIVVRNSIILVDFIELRLDEGMKLSDAVVDAGAVRFKPMMLTAAAVVVGAGVILFDPIFQGLAISLMAGEVASLFLSRSTVPILYYMANRKEYLNKQILPPLEQKPEDVLDHSPIECN
jgi:multidrug efflux pump subunit AcrB